MADVFISYSRKDKDFVKALHTALVKCDRDAWGDCHPPLNTCEQNNVALMPNEGKC